MLTEKVNRETCAWALALIIGLATYMAQPALESRSIQVTGTDATILIRESDNKQMHDTTHVSEEILRTGIVLDNSIR